MRYFFAQKILLVDQKSTPKGKSNQSSKQKKKKDKLLLTHIFCREMKIQGANMNFMFDPTPKL